MGMTKLNSNHQQNEAEEISNIVFVQFRNRCDNKICDEIIMNIITCRIGKWIWAREDKKTIFFCDNRWTFDSMKAMWWNRQ